MASSLTSTSLSSGSLYIGFFLFVFIGVLYFFNDSSDAHKNLREQSFLLAASAFKNGIYIAHSKYQTVQTNDNNLNLWSSRSTGLDYNHNGFPIGTSIKDIQQNIPTKVINCIEIWNFVLGPIKPTIGTNKYKDDFWVELEDKGKCIFHSSHLTKMQLSYHSLTGSVEIVK